MEVNIHHFHRRWGEWLFSIYRTTTSGPKSNFICENIRTKAILMCSFERPGWPGYRDLGFCERDLGNRDEHFPIWTLQPGDRDETFSTKLAAKMVWFWSCMYFHFRSMRDSFINKVTRVHKVLTVANSITLCSTILVVFLEFILVDRAEISHMNAPQNSSR